ncbi:MAG: hypothetical protein ACM31C_19430 [Acidobacteriota bacterium]
MRDALLLAAALAACGGPGARVGGSPDAGNGGTHDSTGGGNGDAAATDVYVYAHSASTLYRVDPDTLAITLVGDFGWPSQVITDQMTDIAIDKTGRMIGVSFSSVYQVDTATAKTTLLSSSLDGNFNGLSFVPAAQLGASGDDILVGTDNADGKVYRIDPMTGTATQVGDMGAGFMSSGDLVAVAGFGTVQTVTGSTNDRLAKLAPQTFAAMPIGTDTGFGQIWGVAFWKNKVYGFTNNGQFILIDPTTGAATLVSQNGVQWWGAAVTTLAPVIQ